MAALTGTPAWEMFKPWAIISIAAADRGRVRVVGEHDSLRVRADRVYGDGRRDAGVFARRAVRRRSSPCCCPRCSCWRGPGCERPTREAAVGPRSIGVGVFLGVRRAVLHAAAGVRRVHADHHGAGTGVASGRGAAQIARRTAAAARRSSRVIAGAIALIGWVPYLVAAIDGPPADSGTAQHYLPPDGAQLSLSRCCELHAARRAVHARHAVAGGRTPAAPTRAGALAHRACWPSTPGRCCRC